MKLKIGIMPEELIRKRMLAISKGMLIHSSEDPKVWFASMKSVSQILCPENIELMKVIKAEQPKSITELSKLTGRAKSNLSITLNSLCSKGLIGMEKTSRTSKPVVKYTSFEIVVDLKFEQELMTLTTGD